jgi:cytochrome c2
MKQLARLKIVLTITIWLFTGVGVAAQPAEVILQIKDNNKQIRTFSLSQLKMILPSAVVKVLDPYEQHLEQYRSFAINALFDYLYGDNWQQQEEVLLTCMDGYQSSLPVKYFLQYKGFLAYEKLDSSRFEITNNFLQQPVVELTPFYLIWDNVNQPHSSQLSQWPYQVMSIEFVTFAERFPQMTPPEGSSDNVKRGFLTFRNFCQDCHSINGDGGNRAMDLNYPINVMEYMDEAKLRIWINNPTDILPDTTMPAFPHHLKNREQQVSDIIAYLNTMAQYKREPTREILTSP